MRMNLIPERKYYKIIVNPTICINKKGGRKAPLESYAARDRYRYGVETRDASLSKESALSEQGTLGRD